MRATFFICQVIDYRPGGAQSAAWRPLTIVRSGRPHGGLLQSRARLALTIVHQACCSGRPHGGLLHLGFGRPHGGLPQMGNRLSFGNR